MPDQESSVSIPTRLACWLLPAALLTPMIFFPLTRDSGIFAYVGGTILDGGLPYRDVFDQKGPGIHYVYALAMAVFGRSDWGVRFFFYLLALGGAQAAASVGRRIAGSAVALPSAICFALAVMEGDKHCPWKTAQAEDVLAVLTLAVVALLSTRDGLRSTGRVFLAGAMLGLSCWFKPTALVPALLIGAAALYRRAREADTSPVAAVFRLSAVATAGFLVPAVAFASYFIYVGIWDDFWSNVVTYNLSGYAGADTGRDLTNAFAFVDVRWRGLLLLAFAGVVIVRTRSATPVVLLWAALVGNWLAVVGQGKYFIYHWTPMIGCVAVLAGCGVSGLYGVLRDRWTNWIAGAIGLAGLVVVPLAAAPADPAYVVREWWLNVARLAAKKTTVDEFRSNVWTGSAKHKVSDEVARYLADHVGDGEFVLIWGHETVVNFESGTRSPTRFAFDAVLSVEGPLRESYRREFLEDLAQRPPAYVVVVTDDLTPFEPKNSDDQLKDFPELEGFIDSNCREEKHIGNFDILSCRSGAGK